MTASTLLTGEEKQVYVLHGVKDNDNVPLELAEVALMGLQGWDWLGLAALS